MKGIVVEFEQSSYCRTDHTNKIAAASRDWYIDLG